jgi:predicted TIM-barrel fold metal-dependent hydrolase
MDTRALKQKAPALSTDCHFHIFGPFDRYPMSTERTYTPSEALVPHYLRLAETIGIQRMVVVQASIYGTDDAVTLDAIAQFGLHRARGVVVIDEGFDDAVLKRMHEQGIRGVRFNMVSGNGTPEDQLEALARRVAPLGWHIQVYAEGEKILELESLLARLPVEVVIDHCGGVKAGLGVGHPQFQALLRLLDSGRAWMKQLPCVFGRSALDRCSSECAGGGSGGTGSMCVGNGLAASADGPGAGGGRVVGSVLRVGAG